MTSRPLGGWITPGFARKGLPVTLAEAAVAILLTYRLVEVCYGNAAIATVPGGQTVCSVPTECLSAATECCAVYRGYYRMELGCFQFQPCVTRVRRGTSCV